MKGRLKGGLALLFSPFAAGCHHDTYSCSDSILWEADQLCGDCARSHAAPGQAGAGGFAREDILEYLDGILLELNGEEGPMAFLRPVMHGIRKI